MPTRRDLLQSLPLLAATPALSMPKDRAAEGLEGLTILFQGDSITDAARDRAQEAEPNHQGALGSGYAFLAAAGILSALPAETKTRVFNRGISGNKVFQLADRWDRDCLSLAPDLLSILIGVNDHWHTLTAGYKGTSETYEQDLDALLTRTRAALPKTRLILCEPFTLPCGAVDATWPAAFNPYRQAARRLAESHSARFVSFHSIFEAACRLAPPTHWAADGVHPTPSGAALMSQAWLRVALD